MIGNIFYFIGILQKSLIQPPGVGHYNLKTKTPLKKNKDRKYSLWVSAELDLTFSFNCLCFERFSSYRNRNYLFTSLPFFHLRPFPSRTESAENNLGRFLISCSHCHTDKHPTIFSFCLASSFHTDAQHNNNNNNHRHSFCQPNFHFSGFSPPQTDTGCLTL